MEQTSSHKHSQKHLNSFIQKKRNRDSESKTANSITSFSEKSIQTEFSEIKSSSSHWKKIASENINELLQKSKEYIFGNYPSFYYKRYLEAIKEKDEKLSILKPEWFEGKNVLDLGCNEGVLTLLIAEHFKPKSIEGIDIDYRLIKNAIKNTKQLMRNTLCSEIVLTEEKEVKTSNKSTSEDLSLTIDNINKIKSIVNELKTLPKSFQLTLSNNNLIKGMNENINEQIQKNIINSKISFQQENYVSELMTVKSSYDTIVALSVIKWVHLNYGDIGVKIFFFNTYHQLNKGGLFIVEPQQWSSYKKSSKLSKEIYSNYKQIKLLPNSFVEYLQKVYEYKLIKTVVSPANSKKVYYRTIYILQK